MSNTTIAKVNVTADHIKKGKKYNCYDCPIAIALFECTKLKWHVNNWAVYLRSNTDYEIPLSVECRLFIDDFDSEKTVMPFEFEIEIDDYILGENK